MTYDRPILLRETLDSILQQTFTDFEVLVGNNNPRHNLSGDVLGIDDDRISFINRPCDLGQLGNMNALLDASHGTYFTWLADDDLYAATFLEDACKALLESDTPVAFTSYIVGECNRFDDVDTSGEKKVRILEGVTFLAEYLSRTLKAIGCYGLFKKECLQQLGGIEKLGHGFSPYSDNLLAIKSCTFDQVAYLDSPLVFFRTHGQSISFTSPDIDAYKTAQEDLLAKSIGILRQASPDDMFQTNLYWLLLWCIQDFESVVRRSYTIRISQAAAYLAFVNRYLPFLKGSPFYSKTIRVIFRMFMKYFRDITNGVGRKRT